jgi:hypothetical protein
MPKQAFDGVRWLTAFPLDNGPRAVSNTCSGDRHEDTAMARSAAGLLRAVAPTRLETIRERL